MIPVLGRRAIGATLLGIVAIGSVLALRDHRQGERAPSSVPVVAAKAAIPTPSLYCEFFDFMHKTVVASYDFALADNAPTHLLLRAQVSPDGTRTAFDDDQRPAWSYAMQDDAPTVTAPDGETRIVMYGLKPHLAGILWGEAGVRSNATRNLEGRCRQAHFDHPLARRIATTTDEKGSPR